MLKYYWWWWVNWRKLQPCACSEIEIVLDESEENQKLIGSFKWLSCVAVAGWQWHEIRSSNSSPIFHLSAQRDMKMKSYVISSASISNAFHYRSTQMCLRTRSSSFELFSKCLWNETFLLIHSGVTAADKSINSFQPKELRGMKKAERTLGQSQNTRKLWKCEW